MMPKKNVTAYRRIPEKSLWHSRLLVVLCVWALLPIFSCSLSSVGPEPAETLSDAIKSGDDDALRALLKSGADVNHKDANGDTPLILAVGHGRQNALSLLLSAGADPNLVDSEGNTALFLAMDSHLITGNFEETVKLLLNAGTRLDLLPNSMNPNENPYYGAVFLKRALDCRSAVLLKAFLSAGVRIEWDHFLFDSSPFKIGSNSLDSFSLLLNAAPPMSPGQFRFCLRGNTLSPDAFRLLLDAESRWKKAAAEQHRPGAEAGPWQRIVDRMTQPCSSPFVFRDPSRFSRFLPLEYSRVVQSPCSLKVFLSNKKRAFENLSDNKTILHFAAWNGHADVVRILLESEGGNRKDIRISCCEKTPLFYASEQNHSDVVRLLLAAGCKVNVDVHFGSPLSQAIENRNPESVDILLSAGADPNAHFPLFDGRWSPLMIAVWNNDFRFVESLLDAGAQVVLPAPNSPQNFSSALAPAALRGNSMLLRVLLAVADPKSLTPAVLNEAIRNAILAQNIECLRSLFSTAAQLGIRKDLDPALFLRPDDAGSTEIIDFLLKEKLNSP